ncbi:DNA polymerase beta-like [Halichondria panicea]|uniref:DNA polymerase beta-like n=1 Tax=Halichondria panicea TaxID=6063 RepID=UPI00312B3C67
MSKRKAPQGDNPNKDICDILIELAANERNVNRNIHKSNVYRKAASILSKHPTRVTSGAEAKTLNGIGTQIAKKINEILSTGKLAKLDKIRASESSQAIIFLTEVSGIGPAAARKLADEGITTLDDLKKNEEKLNHHQKIGVKHFFDFQQRIPRSEMVQLQDIAFSHIHSVDPQFIATVCGSFRRGAVSSGDIDILLGHPTYSSVDTKKPPYIKSIVKTMEEAGFVTDSLSLGESKFMGVCVLPPTKTEAATDEGAACVPPPTKTEAATDEGAACVLPPTKTGEAKEKPVHRRIDIRLVPIDQYFVGLLYFTGSDMFNKTMRSHALDQGFTLNEYSVRPVGDTGVPGEAIPVTSEEEVFDILNYPFKKPEERNL